MDLTETDLNKRNRVTERIENPMERRGRETRGARRGGALILAGLLMVGMAACGNDGGPPQGGAGNGGGPDGPGMPGMMGADRAIPVAAEIVEPREMQVLLRSSANLRAREDVEVLPKQGGVVDRILVEEGNAVRAGQPLAQLDSEEWQLQARQAEARARSARDAAARAEQLQTQGLIADQEVERLRSEAEVAEADLALAELRVRNSVIVAPITGVVTHREIERGQLVNTSTVAYRVADVSRLEAVVGIPERQASRVEPGQPAWVRIEGRAAVEGEVARIRPVVDPESGTVQVVVQVDPGQGGGLRPGQFVNVDIITETLEDRLTLPRTAVLVDGAAPRVYVVSDGRAQEREVTMGTSQAERVEIQAGLEPGDTVVVVGQQNLRPGASVNLMELDGQPTSGRDDGTGATAASDDISGATATRASDIRTVRR